MNCSTFEDFKEKIEPLALSEKTKRQLFVAADEIFSNITKYGSPAGGEHVEITCDFYVSEKRVFLTFSDTGIPFNPLEVPPPDLSVPLAERTVGGLGIFMVKKIMDTLEYARENGKNILVMTKHDI